MPDAALSYAAACRDTEHRPYRLPALAAGLIGRQFAVIAATVFLDQRNNFRVGRAMVEPP